MIVRACVGRRTKAAPSNRAAVHSITWRRSKSDHTYGKSRASTSPVAPVWHVATCADRVSGSGDRAPTIEDTIQPKMYNR
jgi:hypothetical protein